MNENQTDLKKLIDYQVALTLQTGLGLRYQDNWMKIIVFSSTGVGFSVVFSMIMTLSYTHIIANLDKPLSVP
jgi:hypothetical protein